MTKMKIGLVTIGCIVLLFIICLTVHNQNKTLKQIENHAMTNEFSDTLDSYYVDEKDSLELEVYSAEPTISPLKMISLYNYLNEKNEEISQTDMIYREIIERYFGDESHTKELSRRSISNNNAIKFCMFCHWIGISGQVN